MKSGGSGLQSCRVDLVKERGGTLSQGQIRDRFCIGSCVTLSTRDFLNEACVVRSISCMEPWVVKEF